MGELRIDFAHCLSIGVIPLGKESVVIHLGRRIANGEGMTKRLFSRGSVDGKTLVDDGTVAILMASLLFLIPASQSGNGTLMLLPIDQGIEHGPRDFFPNPASKDPDYQFRLAAEAGYSALACQIGMAEKYYPDYAGRVPLILKVNGKTDVPSSSKAFSSCNASVEDGVRLGADAIGYTLYVGSPRQDEDLAQLRQVREDCDRFGMPLVVFLLLQRAFVRGILAGSDK